MKEIFRKLHQQVAQMQATLADANRRCKRLMRTEDPELVADAYKEIFELNGVELPDALYEQIWETYRTM